MRKILIGLMVVIVVVIALALAAVVLIDPDDYRDDIAERASQQLGRQVTLSGPMELKLFPWLAIEISDVGVDNQTDFGQAPPLARVGTAIASVRVWPLLRGELELGAITLEDAELHLVTNRAGRSNLEGLLASEPDRPDAEPDLSGLSLGELRLRQVSLVTLDQRSGERSAVEIEAFSLDPFRAGEAIGFSFSGNLTEAGEPVVRLASLTGTVNVALNLVQVDLSGLVAEFELPQAGGRGSLRGVAAVDLRGAYPIVRMPVLDAVVAVNGLRTALVAVEPVEVSLDTTTRVALSAARLSFNEQPLDASGSFELGERLTARLSLRGEQLDMRAFAGSSEPARQRQGESQPADFEPLKALTVDFDLALASLILSDQLRLSEVDARARLANGLLVLAPMDARLFGGGFEGRVEVDFNQDPPRVVLQPRLSGIMVEQLASLAGPNAPLQGLADMSLDLSFSGFEIEEILASLDGSGSYSVEDGALLGVDLRRLVNEELSTSNLANISRSFGGQTDFERFSGSMQARSGIVELPDLNLVAGDYGLAGRGQLDLPAGMVDYRVDLALGEALTARLPRTVRDATGGRLPLTIAGPMAEPVVMIDLGGIAERALRGELEQRLLQSRRERRGESETDPDDSDGDAATEVGAEDELIEEPAEAEGEDGRVDEAAEASEDEPEQRERGRDVLLRGLLDRRERDRKDDEDPPVDP
jgi:AsmA protein